MAQKGTSSQICMRERYHAALNEGCVTRAGATHYYCHTDHQSSIAARLHEVHDLIRGNPECKTVTGGCNTVD